MSGERVPAALSSLEPDYEILREIGRGGTAIVYLARERVTGGEVAIKLIRAKFLEDDEAIARFAREARFVAQLDHPNVVGVHAVLDLGAAGMALVMSHIAGRTLKHLIQEERPLPPERVVRVMRDVAEALAAAHAIGIVHRDVKPENIFIDADGRALLADFGVARSMSGDTQLTMSGVAIGTPSYMAPEQIDGGELDGRGDVYSLGLVAWEMLSGHRPWEGESLYAVLYHQRHHELPDVRDMRPDVSDEIADVIAGAIEKEPSARWQSMEELIAALDGAAPTRQAKAHVPVSTETVRFARPLSPAPSTPIVALAAMPPMPPAVSPIPPVAASLAAARFLPEELGERRPDRRFAFSRRETALVAAGLLGVLTLGVAAFAVQSRSSDARELRVAQTRTASSGEIGRLAAPSVAAPAAAASGPAAVPDSLSVDAALSSKASTDIRVKGIASGASDSPVGVTLGTPLTASPAVAVSKPDPASRPSAKIPAPAPAPAPAPPAAAVAPPSVSVTAAIGPPAAPARTRVSIVAGGVHTCLVGADGRAFCWGGNDRGQLGMGGGGRLSTPSSVGAELRFTSVAPGLAHSCAIARGGGLWCWGENDHGQLGDRTMTPRATPVRSAVGQSFRSVAAGASHTCALESDGDAWCWGSDSRGQLGDGGALERTAPVAVAGSHRFTSIDVGWNFTCGLVDGGAPMCWGENVFGQLGDGSTIDRRVPVAVLGSADLAAITAGNAHACGVTKGGVVYCWGRNASGELGDGSATARTSPVRVRSDQRFVSIAAGAVHTCAVTDDGEAWCWGRNTYGQLGNGGTSDSNVPVRVTGAHTFTVVRAFGSHTCGATVSGEAFCWGYNSDGQLGDGTRTSRTRPVYVERPGG